MKRLLRYFCFPLLILFLPHVSEGVVFPLEKANVVGNGGGVSNNGVVYLNSTVGESFIGWMGNSSYENPMGYWYMVDQIHIGPTTAVAIASFDVVAGFKGVTVAWVIGSADGLEGFNIYRSTHETDGFVRINDVLIPADDGNEYYDQDVQPGGEYWYRLGAVDRDGEFFSSVVGVHIPRRDVTLDQNRPNPFNPSTMISFYLPATSRITLNIYDVNGKRVRQLLNETRDYGSHDINWDATDDGGSRVSTGVYFYRLHAGNKTITKKLTVLK